MDLYKLVVNYQSVTEKFGRWPSFHDGEVHRFILDSTRRNVNGRRYASIELSIRGWNMSAELTEDGYKLEDDSIVHFLFEEVSDVEMDGLNHQNVLSSLDFSLQSAEDDKELFYVELVHCWGLSGNFKAKRFTVVSVTPFIKE